MARDRNSLENLVLCFGKALDMRPPGADGDDPNWITLGYFDTLKLYPLPMKAEQNNWLEGIYGHNLALSQALDGSSYYHPLHIMKQLTEDGERYQTFYACESPYLFVTLLQGPNLTRETSADVLEAAVAACLGTRGGGTVPEDEEGVAWAAYHTLNLSELVLLWKSRSINAILRCIDKLYLNPAIGDLHSIPAVRFDCLCSVAAGEPLPEALRPKTEVIPLVITRYLVRNAYKADLFFKALPEELRETPCFTTGVEDLSSVFTGLDSGRLMKTLYCRLVGLQRPEDPAVYFREAFLECETHLGVPNSGTPSHSSGDGRLLKRCKELQKRFERCRASITRDGGDDGMNSTWLKGAGELFNALVDMSRNTVADGFCYLILDGADLFCQELERRVTPNSEQVGLIQRFLRGWGTLMEQALRLDGKFSQQPGFSPALCDIPSSLLEFYLAFTAQCGCAMQIGSGDSRRFCLLLVPKLCRRIKVETVFSRDPPCDRLLYVDVPMELLYEPLPALCHLCHEIAHFCGDSWRLRSQREERYLCICAQELAVELSLDEQSVVELILKDLRQPSYSHPAYLERLHKEVVKQVARLLEQEGKAEAWLEKAFQFHSRSVRQEYADRVVSCTRIQVIRSAIEECPSKPNNPFFEILSEFYFLFRECYADTAVIFALGLRAVDYIGLIRQELALYRRDWRQGENLLYHLYVERWAAVLYAVFPNDAELALSMEDWPVPLKRFVADLRECSDFLFTEKEYTQEVYDKLKKTYHRPESFCHLVQYLKQCHQEMQEEAQEHDGRQRLSLERLRAGFRSIALEYDVDCGACCQIVMDYRNGILDRE